MTYGTIKVDTVTFTDAGIDKSVTLSGLVQNPTFSGNVTVTGTLSGVTVTGTTANFTSGNFTNISGGTHTITSGVFAAGSAASPSITFTGDLNTGIYSPGADQVAISTGGSGRLFVDASGNIKVSTGEIFQTSASSYIRLDGGTGSGTGANVIVFGESHGSAPGRIALTAVGTGAIIASTAGTERLRITSAGLVGVGTSSPVATLHVDGSGNQNIRVSSTTHSNFIQAGCGSGSTYHEYKSVYRLVDTDNGERLRITSAGLVGIGNTTGLGGTLGVSGNISLSGAGTGARYVGLLDETSTYAGSYILQAGGGSAGFGGAITMYGHSHATYPGSVYIGTSAVSNGKVYIGTNNALDPTATQMTVATTGVGIGFTSVEAALHAGGNSASPVILAGAESAGSDVKYTFRQSRGTITSPGDTGGEGIKLSFEKRASSSWASPIAEIYAAGDGSGSTGYLEFLTKPSGGSATPRARIDSSGRLLVGTSTSPSAGALTQYANFVARGNTGGPGFAGIITVGRGEAASSIASGEEIGYLTFSDLNGNEFATIHCAADANAGSGDYPGRLVFSTTADGASSPTERMRIAANGQITHSLNGTTNAASLVLNVGGAGDPGNSGWITPRIDFTGSSVASLGTTFIGATGSLGGRSLVFATGADGAGSERARLTASGQLLVGTSSASGANTLFESSSTTANAANVALVKQNSGTADQAGQQLHFYNFGPAGTARAADTEVGSMRFYGSQPTSGAAQEMARITCAADLIQTGTNTSGRLVFSTTADGASSPTERMRIDSSGRVGIGTTPSYQLEVAGPTGDNIISLFRSGDATAANNAGGGFRATSSATATSRLAQVWLDADGANLSGGDYFFIQKNGNSGTVDFNQYSNAAMTFFTNNTERFRCDSAGRLLVGTSSARSTGTINWLSQIESGDNTGLSITSNSDNTSGAYLSIAKSRGTSVGSNTIVQNNDFIGAILFSGADGSTLNSQAASINCQVDGTPGVNDMPGRLVFSTTADGANSPTERMRIDSTGRLLFGESSFSSNAGIQLNFNAGNCLQSINHVTGTASGEAYLFFNYNGSSIGNITQNGTTAVAYNTASDYRLKENIVAVTDGITRLQQLKPSRFNFTSEPDKTVDGFIAHEAQAVVPECVTGIKDAVDADGNPIYQGIDQSKLVPLLTAALQEAVAKIESLEARLTVAGI